MCGFQDSQFAFDISLHALRCCACICSLSVVCSVDFMYGHFQGFNPAPVIGVVCVLNPTASVIGKHEGVLFVVLVRLLRGFRFPRFQVIICFTNVCKFLSYSYNYTIQFLIKVLIFTCRLQLTFTLGRTLSKFGLTTRLTGKPRLQCGNSLLGNGWGKGISVGKKIMSSVPPYFSYLVSSF